MTNDKAFLIALWIPAIIWLLFCHWQIGVSVLLLLILANQGKANTQ